MTLSVLVRQTAEIRQRAPAEQEQVVIAWPIEREGRKRRAAAAVVSAGGETLAVAEALLVEPRVS